MSPEDIDKLTIAEVRAIAERAAAALKLLRELGIRDAAIGVGPAAPAFAAPRLVAVPTPAPSSPFPCPGCGRTAVEKPGEPASPIECQLCGNHLPLDPNAPGARQSNKGPLVMDADMLARRQALISQPAFGPDGEPT